ncbi:MAG: hypothetical protein AAB563_01445 [Patescibacteria group bacterium]
MRHLGKVDCTWSAELAYAIGLIVTDGCLSNDNRHMNLTSKDVEQIQTFARLLNLKNKVGKKSSGSQVEKKYFSLQFGDVRFYDFLLSVGLTPRKSKTMGSIKVPEQYFRDFLRGHFDGDGCSHSYFDPVWEKSFRLYLSFISASKKHLIWLKKEILKSNDVRGNVIRSGKNGGMYLLRFAKYDSMKLFDFIYYEPELPCLTRKRLKFAEAVATARLSNKLV